MSTQAGNEVQVLSIFYSVRQFVNNRYKSIKSKGKCLPIVFGRPSAAIFRGRRNWLDCEGVSFIFARSAGRRDGAASFRLEGFSSRNESDRRPKKENGTIVREWRSEVGPTDWVG